jgi:hypothetical protein
MIVIEPVKDRDEPMTSEGDVRLENTGIRDACSIDHQPASAECPPSE